MDQVTRMTMAISKNQNKNSAYASRHQISLRASCWLTTAPEKEPTTRAVKTFLSSRLIMNSRQLWNSHHRHKFLRAEPSRDILKFRVSEMVFKRYFPLWMPCCFVSIHARLSARLGTMWSKCPRHSTTSHSFER